MGLARDEMVLMGPAMLSRPEISPSSNGRGTKLGGKHHIIIITGGKGRFRKEERT